MALTRVSSVSQISPSMTSDANDGEQIINTMPAIPHMHFSTTESEQTINITTPDFGTAESTNKVMVTEMTLLDFKENKSNESNKSNKNIVTHHKCGEMNNDTDGILYCDLCRPQSSMANNNNISTVAHNIQPSTDYTSNDFLQLEKTMTEIYNYNPDMDDNQ
eukprot:512124_1